MAPKRNHLQRLLLAGYIGGFGALMLVYVLAGYLPEAEQFWRGLLQEVSLNLAIALTISFGSYALLRPLLVDRDRKNLEDFQKAALDLLTLEKGVREAGVVRIYENLSDEVFRERLAAAQERVYVFSIWLDRPEERLGEVIEDLSRKGVTIRILQADPASEVCKIRADSQKALFPEESAFEPEFISRIIRKNNAYFEELKDRTGARLEVRQFNLMPPFSLILIDDSAFIRFYGYGVRVASTPHIEFRFNGDNDEFTYFKDFILYQFETIWTGSQQVF